MRNGLDTLVIVWRLTLLLLLLVLVQRRLGRALCSSYLGLLSRADVTCKQAAAY
jgi:hypothetical protein